MEKVILEATTRYMKDKMVTGNSHYRFIWGKSCLMNLTVFYDERVGTEDDRGCHLSALARFSHGILADKLRKLELEG